MIRNDQRTAAQLQEPPVVIDAAHFSRLQGLALGATSASAEAARLLDELERAEILPHDRMPGNIVNIGSEVTFRDDESGRVQTAQLVFPGEADISKRRVSVLTPIGAALIGLSEGQRISWTTRDGSQRYLTVLKVRPAEDPEDGTTGGGS